jgi:hypothetical protein
MLMPFVRQAEGTAGPNAKPPRKGGIQRLCVVKKARPVARRTKDHSMRFRSTAVRKAVTLLAEIITILTGVIALADWLL